MNINKLVPFKGQVVILDLSNGVQVMTRIMDVKVETNEVSCKDLVVFAITPQGVVQPVPYGVPLYQQEKTVDIESTNIVMILKAVNQQQYESYQRFTSGIVTATPSALDNLAGVDFSKIGQ